MEAKILTDWGGAFRDVRRLIVKDFLDRPSSLALALTSRGAYDFLKRSDIKNEFGLKYYNSFDFLDDALIDGASSRSLVDFALDELSSFTDLLALESAIKADITLITKKIYDKLYCKKVRVLARRYLYGKMAEFGNVELARFFFERDPSRFSTQYRTKMARFISEQFQLHGFKIYDIISRPLWQRSDTVLACEAITLGKFESVKKFAPKESSLWKDISTLFLERAITESSLEQVTYAIQNGASLDSKKASLIRNCHILFYLKSKFPADPTLQGIPPELVWSLYDFTLDGLKLIEAHQEGRLNTEKFEPSFLFLAYLPPDNFSYDSVHPYSPLSDLINAIRYLYDKYDYRWDLEDIKSAHCWVTNIKDLQWLIERSSDFHPLKNPLPAFNIKAYLITRLVSDVDILQLALKRASEVTLDCLFEASFMVNNLETLEVLLKSRSGSEFESDGDRTTLIHKIAKIWVQLFKTHILKRGFIVEKKRPRFHNWIQLLQLLIRKRFHFGPNQVFLLRKIPNSYFQIELDKILKEIERHKYANSKRDRAKARNR